jgi:hypothetical protein
MAQRATKFIIFFYYNIISSNVQLSELLGAPFSSHRIADVPSGLLWVNKV